MARWFITRNGDTQPDPDQEANPGQNWVHDDGVIGSNSDEGFSADGIQAYVDGLTPEEDVTFGYAYLGPTWPPPDPE